MAEIAAGAIVAEEVVSTTVQGAAATYAVAKPTMPLKATFNRIATSSDDKTRQSLARSGHSVSVIGNKAYIFGGETASGQLASNEIHSVALSPSDKLDHEYALIPAVPDVKDGKVPVGRTKHAACAFNVCVAIFGGHDGTGKLVDGGADIWLYNSAKSAWETLPGRPSSPNGELPPQRIDAKLFDHSNNLLLYGGIDAKGEPLTDIWEYSYPDQTWTRILPSAPLSTTNAAFTNHTLHLLSSLSNLSGELHSLDLSTSNPKWSTHPFPTNPLTPGPRPRANAGLIPITTGHGRNYLLHFFGSRLDPTLSSPLDPETAPAQTTDPTMWGDVWTLQVASSKPAPAGSLEGFGPAKIKDLIREKLGFDSGEASWAEVEVLPPEDLERLGEDGKVHPGPRAEFGCDALEGGKGVVFWGGVNAKGEREGDGWVILLE